MNAEFSLYLTVDDAQTLARAAAARAVADGVFDSEDDYLEEYPHEDVSSHLRMLLDPGLLAGCTIHDSVVETD
ncbi:hypothetical protein [Xanthobacter wiegelii]|uniref:hypothetical protein n=1 Tax=Xanthobacter wiegelii TaxID=3119913 RepID=UPI003726E938